MPFYLNSCHYFLRNCYFSARYFHEDKIISRTTDYVSILFAKRTLQCHECWRKYDIVHLKWHIYIWTPIPSTILGQFTCKFVAVVTMIWLINKVKDSWLAVFLLRDKDLVIGDENGLRTVLIGGGGTEMFNR